VTFTVAQAGAMAVLRGEIPHQHEDGSPITDAVLRIQRTGGASVFPSESVFRKEAETAAEFSVHPMQERVFEWSEELPPLPPPPPEGAKAAPPPTVYYGVELRSGKSRRGLLSKIQSITPKPFTAAPGGLDVSAAERLITLSWQAVEGGEGDPAGYLVFRAEGKKPFERMTPSPIDKPFFEDDSFQFDVSYRYRVRSQKPGWAESADSEEAQVTPHDSFAPTVPAGLAASVEETGIRLFWFPNAEPDLDGYTLERRQGEEEWAPLHEGLLRETLFLDTGAKPGERYEYRLRAADRSGNSSAPSEPVERSMRSMP
jgi:hypothetical protein